MRTFTKLAFAGISALTLGVVVGCDGGPDTGADPETELQSVVDEAGADYGEPACGERCVGAAREFLAKCREEGGTDCRKRAVHGLRACAAECGRDLAPKCGERCGHLARAVGERCLEAGGTEEACREAAHAAGGRCLLICRRPPPGMGDGLTCGERCRHVGREVGERCHEAGGTDEECHGKAMEAGRACAERCADRGEGEGGEGEGGDRGGDGTCADRCHAEGGAAGKACLEAGGSAEECRAKAMEAARACAAGCA